MVKFFFVCLFALVVCPKFADAGWAFKQNPSRSSISFNFIGPDGPLIVGFSITYLITDYAARYSFHWSLGIGAESQVWVDRMNAFIRQVANNNFRAHHVGALLELIGYEYVDENLLAGLNLMYPGVNQAFRGQLVQRAPVYQQAEIQDLRTQLAAAQGQLTGMLNRLPQMIAEAVARALVAPVIGPQPPQEPVTGTVVLTIADNPNNANGTQATPAVGGGSLAAAPGRLGIGNSASQ